MDTAAALRSVLGGVAGAGGCGTPELGKQSIMERAGLPASVQVDGPYYIVNNYSGKCLNVKDASNVDGALVIQYTCGFPLPNDVWWIVGRDTYYLINDHSAKCLNVKDASHMDGAHVIQYKCRATPLNNDVWMFYMNVWTYYINLNSSKYLSVKDASLVDGASVIQYKCESGFNNDAWLAKLVNP